MGQVTLFESASLDLLNELYHLPLLLITYEKTAIKDIQMKCIGKNLQKYTPTGQSIMCPTSSTCVSWQLRIGMVLNNVAMSYGVHGTSCLCTLSSCGFFSLPYISWISFQFMETIIISSADVHCVQFFFMCSSIVPCHSVFRLTQNLSNPLDRYLFTKCGNWIVGIGKSMTIIMIIFLLSFYIL